MGKAEKQEHFRMKRYTLCDDEYVEEEETKIFTMFECLLQKAYVVTVGLYEHVKVSFPFFKD